jgi:hypothetical protein
MFIRSIELSKEEYMILCLPSKRLPRRGTVFFISREKKRRGSFDNSGFFFLKKQRFNQIRYFAWSLNFQPDFNIWKREVILSSFQIVNHFSFILLSKGSGWVSWSWERSGRCKGVGSLLSVLFGWSLFRCFWDVLWARTLSVIGGPCYNAMAGAMPCNSKKL